MSDQSYLLEIYDADEFKGPNPLLMTSKGVINGPENTQYLILETQQNASSNGNSISQLAVRAHYNGDTISRIQESVSTVGIAFLKEEIEMESSRDYGFEDFIFWKVGKINPKSNGAL